MALWDELQNPAPGLANGSPVTATFTSAPTAGNLLVAVCHADAQHDGPPSGWSTASPSTDGAASGVWGAIYYKIAAGTEGTVTVAATGAGRGRIHIFEFDAAGQAVLFDQAATPNGNSTNVVSWQVPSLTVDGLSIVAVLLNNNAGTWGTFNSSYVTTSTHTGGGANPASAVGTRVVTGTVAPTITWTTGRMPTGMHVSFKVDAAPDPPPQVTGAGLDLALSFGPGTVEIPAEQIPQVAGAGFSATLALGPAEVDSFLIEVDRTAPDEATVAYSEHDADRHVVEHYRGETLVADYDPAANPQTVVNVEDGDLVRVGAVTGDGAVTIPDPTWDTTVSHEVSQGRRELVRTSDGTLYMVRRRDNTEGAGSAIAVWRYDDQGNEWELLDHLNAPKTSDGPPQQVDPIYMSTAVVVDSNDVLHIVTTAGGPNATYVPFFPGFGYGTPETLNFDFGHGGEVWHVDLAVDSADVLHMAVNIIDDSFSDDEVMYRRRTSGVWSDEFTIFPPGGVRVLPPSITVDAFDRPVIAFATGGSLWAALVHDPDPQFPDVDTFEISTASTSNVQGSVSVAVDAAGDAWVAYRRSDGTLGLVRHDAADPWDTWDTPVTNGDACGALSLAIHGGIPHVAYLEPTTGGAVKHAAYDGSWTSTTTLVASGASAAVGLRWQANNLEPTTDLELTYWDGTVLEPVLVFFDPSAQTTLWSDLVPIPEFTGDTVPEVAGAGLQLDLTLGPGIVDAPTATVPQVAGAGLDLTLTLGPGQTLDPGATVPQVSGAGLSLALTLGPGQATTPTAGIPDVAGAGLNLTLTLGPGVTSSPTATIPEVAGAGLAFTLGLGPGQAQAVAPTLHEVEGAGLHLTVTFGPGDTRHPATGPLVDLVARPLDAYIRPSAAAAAFIAPTAVGAAHITDSAALEAHSRDKAATEPHINRPGGTVHIADKPHTEPHINRPQFDTLVNA